MSESNYAGEVSKLLNIGAPVNTSGKTDWQGKPEWVDYPAQYGIRPEHIPDLIRLATDEALHQAETESSEVYGPIHAWRALAQLKAVEAVEPLLGLFRRVDEDDDDWAAEELPRVMGMIGPAAIKPLLGYVRDADNLLWARISAAISLQRIGEMHPEARLEAINALSSALENYSQNDEGLNGELVAALAQLDAIEAAPLVEQAFQANRVDEIVMGDWEDFQVEVGLLEQRITDPDDDLDFNPFFPSLEGVSSKSAGKKEDKQVKKKRKQAKESRKKNRSKKRK